MGEQVTYLGQVQVKNQVFCNLALLCGKVRKVDGKYVMVVSSPFLIFLWLYT